MARYSQKFKERVVVRLLPPESSPVEAVSQMVGISVTTLERWRAECLAKPSGDEVRHWTAAARLEAVIATAAMNDRTRSLEARGVANMASIRPNWRDGSRTRSAAWASPARRKAWP